MAMPGRGGLVSPQSAQNQAGGADVDKSWKTETRVVFESGKFDPVRRQLDVGDTFGIMVQLSAN